MLFPIIEVKDKHSGRTHMVGKNSHDELIITGGCISYYNLQCGDGTGEGDGYGYEFVGEDDDYLGVTVRFVDFEELKEIYEKHKKEKAEHDKRMKEIFGEGVRVLS